MLWHNQIVQVCHFFLNGVYVNPSTPSPLNGQCSLKKQNRLATALYNRFRCLQNSRNLISRFRGQTAQVCALKVLPEIICLDDENFLVICWRFHFQYLPEWYRSHISVKSVKWNFLKFCFTEMSHRDISRKKRYLYIFDSGLRAREKNCKTDICCVEIFRRIFWVSFASPPNFYFRCYSGFRPLFGIPFLAHNSKNGSFLRYGSDLELPFFFNFLSGGLFTFLGGEVFWKLSLLLQFSLPVLLNFWRGQKNICFGKKTLIIVNFIFRMWRIKWRMPKCKWRKEWKSATGYCYAKARRNIFVMTILLLNINRFIVPKWRMERWMPKWQKKTGYGVCSWNLPTNVAKCNEHVKKNVSDPCFIIGGNLC